MKKYIILELIPTASTKERGDIIQLSALKLNELNLIDRFDYRITDDKIPLTDLKEMINYDNDKFIYKNTTEEILNEFKTKNIKFDARKIIFMSLNKLRVTKTKDHYIIGIDRKALCPGYNLSFEEICRIINYGTIDIKGFPIYTNAFEHVLNNLKKYFVKYFYG